ncbi:hypothetical protein [Streptomyces sp. NBC_01579]|uniref:hypothetical protein n=1 Tax=Streptomyces sp. NBC_01579 TaxID=2975885 RepID=UPI003863B526
MVLARRTAMVCAAGVLALVGCSPGGGGSMAEPTHTAVATVTASSASPSPGSPTSSPSVSVPASTTPSPVPVTGAGQKLVTMTVSGGFAGVNRQVVLRGDGTVRTTDRGESVVRRTTAAQFMELRTLLGDRSLADVPGFAMNMGAADMFQYTLQFDDRTVITDRSAEEPALDRLIDALDKWLPTQ